MRFWKKNGRLVDRAMNERMTEERYADLMRLPADSFRGIELELLREIRRLRDGLSELADQFDDDMYSAIGDMIRAVLDESAK